VFVNWTSLDLCLSKVCGKINKPSCPFRERRHFPARDTAENDP